MACGVIVLEALKPLIDKRVCFVQNGGRLAVRLYMTLQEIHNNTINLSTNLLSRVEKAVPLGLEPKYITNK
jgi:hypothetical protein